MHPSLVVESWLLLADQREGFTQDCQLEGLALITYHQPLPSVEDQLSCTGAGWSVAVYWVPRVFWVAQAKVSPHLRFAQGHPA